MEGSPVRDVPIPHLSLQTPCGMNDSFRELLNRGVSIREVTEEFPQFHVVLYGLFDRDSPTIRLKEVMKRF